MRRLTSVIWTLSETFQSIPYPWFLVTDQACSDLVRLALHAQDDSGDPHYAIPPLDGVNWQQQDGAPIDSKMNWKQRKAQFMAGIDSREAVETYIKALDAGISDTIAKLAASDGEFALWDTINRWG